MAARLPLLVSLATLYSEMSFVSLVSVFRTPLLCVQNKGTPCKVGCNRHLSTTQRLLKCAFQNVVPSSPFRCTTHDYIRHGVNWELRATMTHQLQNPRKMDSLLPYFSLLQK